MKLRGKLNQLGPGLLVTAAFIGPGTITTCTLSGAGYGYALLWGLVFSVFATIVLQEMTVRLGVIGKQGLGETLRGHFKSPIAKYSVIVLVISAIFVGNAAYETGNILGASLGLIEITGISYIYLSAGDIQLSVWGPVIGIIAFILLEVGTYKSLEKVIIGLVLVMSFSFLTTAFVIKPDIGSIFKGMMLPSIPKGSIYMLISLIGTTVVPYNLFLHASTVREKWTHTSQLPIARTDLFLSVILGGAISMSIIVTSATAFFHSETTVQGASDLSTQLKPLLGDWAGVLMAVGLFAAGISSAITAPLAAAYSTAGILGQKVNMKSPAFRWSWRIILVIGTVFSAIGFSPLKVIVFAQFTNGLLLPLVAIFLLIVMNSKSVLGNYRNNVLQNIIGFAVILIMLGLGVRGILKAVSIF